jgi:hypothetical protein
MSDNGIPPLAPDDKPFDFDEDDLEGKPFHLTRWWVVLAVIVTIALVASLITPVLFNLWN